MVNQFQEPAKHEYGSAGYQILAWTCSYCSSCNTTTNSPTECPVCLTKRDSSERLKVLSLNKPPAAGTSENDENLTGRDELLKPELGRDIRAPAQLDLERGIAYGNIMNPPRNWEYTAKFDPNREPVQKYLPEDIVELLQHLNEKERGAIMRGELLESDRAKYFGFRPEDLIRSGCIEDENVKPNNLTCEVHPIFHKDHWPALSQVVYDFLLPSLRLATLFLLHPRLAQFWVTLVYGERVVDPIKTEQSGYLSTRVIDLEPNEENHAAFKDFLNKIGTEQACISFHFSRGSGPLATARHCFGATNYIHYLEVARSMYPVDWKKNPHDRPWHAPITLSADFYASITKRVLHGFPEENQRLRFYLFFTVTLVHEVAHAISFIELSRPGRTERAEFTQEPLFRDWEEIEVGWTWEQYVLGGMVNPVNTDCDCQYGLSNTQFPIKRYGPPGTDWRLFRMIPMAYVSWIQQQEVWDNSYYRGFEDKLKMPTEGMPVGLGYEITTTLSAEELRRSDVASLLEAAVDQPGLFGASESNHTANTIAALRGSLKEVDPDETFLKAFENGTQHTLVQSPTMTRESWPDINEEQFHRLQGIAMKLYEHYKIKYRAAMEIHEFNSKEAEWEKEEADIARQLDSEVGPEELREMANRSKALHYISVEEWSVKDKELKEALEKQEAFEKKKMEFEGHDSRFSISSSSEGTTPMDTT